LSNPISKLIVARDGQLRMDYARGGSREGAGRKGIGVTRKLSLTLPEEAWDRFDDICRASSRSKSELLREIVVGYLSAASQGKNQEDSYER